MICMSCGNSTFNNAEICNHHHYVSPFDNGEWAQSNRLWCDFFHRGIVPPRGPESMWWTVLAEVS